MSEKLNKICEDIQQKTQKKSIDEINTEISKLENELDNYSKEANDDDRALLLEKINKLKKEKEDITNCTKNDLTNETQNKSASDLLNNALDNSAVQEEIKSDLSPEALEELNKLRRENKLNLSELQKGKVEYAKDSFLSILIGFLKYLTNFKFPTKDQEDEKDYEKLETLAGSEWETLSKTGAGNKFEKYFPSILKYSNQMGVDPGVILRLYIKEGSHGNLQAGPGGNLTAHGLGQITGDTWNYVVNTLAKNHIKHSFDRNDADSQIIASIIYLKYCAETKGVSHRDAIIYYHTGPNVHQGSDFKKYLKNNPAVAKFHSKSVPTMESYLQAARKYYLDN